MTMSDQINLLAEALSKAQGAMKNAIKDAANPFFKSHYADLASVWDACREPLSANGLSVVQVPETRNGEIVVHTILLHSSGQWINGELAMTPVKNDPQGTGSAITYARRYALSGFAGIAPDDDDGNAASGAGKAGEATSKPAVSFKKPVTTKAAEPVSGTQWAAPVHPGDYEGDVALDMLATAVIGAAERQGMTLPKGEAAKVEYCTLDQQDWLRLKFKEAVPAQYHDKIDGLRRDWLKLNGFVKADGSGSSTMIPRKDFKAIAKRMLEYAATFNL